MSTLPARGLYAITDSTLLPPRRLSWAVEQAILGGAAVIQYRDKSDDSVLRRRQALELLAVCRRHQVPLIINDDVELAGAVGADGVHLGRADTPLLTTRDTLGKQAIIGISCYNKPELALHAQEQGANYVAFGRFFPSSTKPRAVQATIPMLTDIRSQLFIPVVAIGGITPDNGASLLAAGADLLAVVRGIFGASDPRTAAARYASVFDEPPMHQ